jgi:polyferredoxin
MNSIYTYNYKNILGLLFGSAGLGLLLAKVFNIDLLAPSLLGIVAALLLLIGIILYALGTHNTIAKGLQLSNTQTMAITAKGWSGWVLAFALTGFYVLLYWFPELLGKPKEGSNIGNTGLIAGFDGLSYILNGRPATQWFVYGVFYTVAVLGFGLKFILKYRHSRYQVIRTISVMFFQLVIAFLLPEWLEKLNPDKAYFAKDVKNLWPLNYYFFEDWHIKNLIDGGSLGKFFLYAGLAMIFVVSPILTYFFGKRWYCSWVCGCGGLAETAGDGFRHLSSKSKTAWQIERWLIHTVLVFIVITTIAVLHQSIKNNPSYFGFSATSFLYAVLILSSLLVGIIYYFKKQALQKDALIGMGVAYALIVISIVYHLFAKSNHIFYFDAQKFKTWYGFFIGAAFSGVIGVGFYPLMGSRVWCRFGCPMAAILGIQQKLFSRFTINSNGGQCISCGNCSTYCEMGIDVRAYAEKSLPIKRASCVGCGICSTVCPRGVLKLENNHYQKNYQQFINGGNITIAELLQTK